MPKKRLVSRKTFSKLVLVCTLSLWLTLLLLPAVNLAAPLEEIQHRGKLIIAVKNNLRPLAFIDEKSKLQGLEIDIAKQLGQELLGNPEAVVLQSVTNQERLDAVLTGKVDLTIARVTATASRARLVNFSRHYYLDSTSFVTKDAKVQHLADLSKKTIAVLNDSSTIAVVRHHVPQAQLIGVNSYQEALSHLNKGEADVFAADRSILVGWVQEYPQYHLLPHHLGGTALCVVMPKGLQYADLWIKVDDAIAQWQRSGWLESRLAYWGL